MIEATNSCRVSFAGNTKILCSGKEISKGQYQVEISFNGKVLHTFSASDASSLYSPETTHRVKQVIRGTVVDAVSNVKEQTDYWQEDLLGDIIETFSTMTHEAGKESESETEKPNSTNL